MASLQSRLSSLITAIGADIKALQTPKTLVVALPGSPVDGQECFFLADSGGSSGGPVVWHLKYRSFDSKWYFIGGAPLRYLKLASAGFDQQNTTTGAYTDLPTTGAVGITLPLAGEYLVSIQGLADSPVDGQQTYMSFKYGSTAASDNWAIRWRSAQLQSNAAQFKVTNIAATNSLILQMKVTQTGGRIEECGISAHPVRVS